MNKVLDVQTIREQFPILHQTIRGKPLIFLDSGASSQKPQQVIASLESYYRYTNANVHRGIYKLSEEATYAYEQARRKVARFIHASSAQEIIFTRNTTESINLVAYAWGCTYLRPGDHILLTVMEHHSNLLPWQALAQRIGANIDYLRIDEEGRLDLSTLDQKLTQRTKMVALTHQSNVLGTINPVQDIARYAHEVGALVLVDGAQSVPHMPVNVQELGIDFLAFSGHKMCGPTGVGVLWGRHDLLQSMPPFLSGGSMVQEVYLDKCVYADVPARFEAGTPAIGEAIALGDAIDFLTHIGLEAISHHEYALVAYALERFRTLEHVTILGPHSDVQRGGALAFTVKGLHPHKVAELLDEEGIAVRAGRHCAHPLHRMLGVPASTRASFYLYNSYEDIDCLITALERLEQVAKVMGMSDVPPPEPCRKLMVSYSI